MAMIKKSITLTDQQEAWIKSQMSSGHYATDSEIIREAIREKQMRMDEVELIRAKLIEGEQGEFSTVPREAFLAQIKSDLIKDGKI